MNERRRAPRVLEEALGSRAKVRLVRALVQRTGREISTEALCGVLDQSSGTLVPALQQLAQTGLVRSRVDGRARLWMLDDAHAAAPLVRRLFDEEARILDRACDEATRRALPARVRFAAWTFEEQERDGRGCSVVRLTLIADEPDAALKHAQESLKARPDIVPLSVGVDDARRQLAQGGPLVGLLERGRVVFADEAWLRG